MRFVERTLSLTAKVHVSHAYQVHFHHLAHTHSLYPSHTIDLLVPSHNPHCISHPQYCRCLHPTPNIPNQSTPHRHNHTSNPHSTHSFYAYFSFFIHQGTSHAKPVPSLQCSQGYHLVLLPPSHTPYPLAIPPRLILPPPTLLNRGQVYEKLT